MLAYILAGGKSSRFGSDKARAIVDGKPIIVSLKQALERAGEHVFVVSDRRERYSDLEIDSIVDLRREAGPLAGLETALHHQLLTAGDGWILLANCDIVRWSPAWTRCLAESVADQFDAIIFADERPQPLPGLYHTRLLPVIEAQFTRQQFSVRCLLSACTSRVKTLMNIQNSPNRWSFNTSEQLSAITRKLPKPREETYKANGTH